MKPLALAALLFCFNTTAYPAITGTLGPVPEKTKVFASDSKQDSLKGLISVDSFNLKIVAPSTGVQYYRNGILFLVDSRDESRMIAKHLSFGTTRAYYGTPGVNTVGEHNDFSPLEAFSYPCDAVTFNSSGDTMYFSRIGEKGEHEKIYMARYGAEGIGHGSWITEQVPLEFCTGYSIYSNPSLSADGKMMIFASDMGGSYGGTDIFVVTRQGSGWSKPYNAGKNVNSSGHEYYPFLDKYNNIYLSSTGHTGYGGYDIFVCRYNGTGWDKARNLSAPVNSADDDLAFKIDPAGARSAFFTRRQRNDGAGMQLYRVTHAGAGLMNDTPDLISLFNPQPSLKKMVAQRTVKQETKPSEQRNITAASETKPLPKKEAVRVSPSVPETTTAENDLKVVYRVQFLSLVKPRGSYKINISGTEYSTMEYFYKGAYRQTVGEFGNLRQAVEFRDKCKTAGYEQAFVAAFRGKERSLDQALFK